MEKLQIICNIQIQIREYNKLHKMNSPLKNDIDYKPDVEPGL
jgi:hypothetical protein